VIEAVMLWNEPNNKSHWAYDADPDWAAFAEMIRLGCDAVEAENPALARVLGGMSPIDPAFVELLARHGVLDRVTVLAVHGFPLDWNHWSIHGWPQKLADIRSAAPGLPVWVSEVGVSTFAADEVQVFGLKRTAELLLEQERVPRVHWYSLLDLPGAWEASTRHKAAEGASYFRHFHMGLIREDGTPKPAADVFARLTPEMGVVQWFHFEDPRFDDAVRWLNRLGVKRLRTGLSWADSYIPGCERWFDRMMAALEPFDTTVTICFTPTDCALEGVDPAHTSPPRDPAYFAEFCQRMVRRYAPGATVHAPAAEGVVAAGPSWPLAA
jgi:beta-xylosidase